jgi:hypothetical protein
MTCSSFCVFRSNVANAIALGVDLVCNIAIHADFDPVSEFSFRIYYVWCRCCCSAVANHASFRKSEKFIKLERERGLSLVVDMVHGRNYEVQEGISAQFKSMQLILDTNTS